MHKQAPVFVVGSPRSGTTLFRNLLRQNPAFLCPEETHLFRWNEPFASTDYQRLMEDNETLIYHRELDGVTREEYARILGSATNKGDLFSRYLGFLQAKRGLDDNVIYIDKTPQHVYSLALIRRFFPDMKVIHVVRNPLNVVTSLMRGRDFAVQSLPGALSYWLEAVGLIDEYLQDSRFNIIEVQYEELVGQPAIEMRTICEFLEVGPFSGFDLSIVSSGRDRFQEFLQSQQVSYILEQSKKLGQKYGYQ